MTGEVSGEVSGEVTREVSDKTIGKVIGVTGEMMTGLTGGVTVKMPSKPQKESAEKVVLGEEAPVPTIPSQPVIKFLRANRKLEWTPVYSPSPTCRKAEQPSKSSTSSELETV